MGTLYMDLEQYEEALKQFEKVLSTDKTNNKLLYNIGNLHKYFCTLLILYSTFSSLSSFPIERGKSAFLLRAGKQS